MQGEQRLRQSEVLQQSERPARVLGRDQVCACQRLANPIAQVPHVADGSGDDFKPARLIAHYNPLVFCP
jgi:hypothetical protein